MPLFDLTFRKKPGGPVHSMDNYGAQSQEEAMKTFKAYWRDFLGVEVLIESCHLAKVPVDPAELELERVLKAL